MKIYIAGKIAGDRRYRAKFREAAKAMEAAGHVVLNPATLLDGLTDGDYMRICMAMVDAPGGRGHGGRTGNGRLCKGTLLNLDDEPAGVHGATGDWRT